MPPYVRITKHLYSCIKHILRHEKCLSYKKSMFEISTTFQKFKTYGD